MANNWGTQSLVAKEILFQFEQTGKVARNVDWRSEKFEPANNTGETINFRRPTISDVTTTTPGANGTVAGAPTYTDLKDVQVPLTIEKKFVANFQVGVDDLSLRLTREQAIDRHIRPTVNRMARMIDSYLAQKALLFAGQVIGSPSAPATGDALLTNMAQAQALMNARGREDDGDSVIITPETVATTLQIANLKLFNPDKAVSALYKTGLMGQYANFDFYRSPLLPMDNALATGTITVNGAGQGVAVWTQTWNLVTAGWTSATVPAGTKIKIPSVNWVNPDTKADTGIAATFVVTQTATVTGGAATLVLSEPLIASGAHQNVTAAPANGASITVLSVASGATPSLAFSRKAIIAASPRISLPRNLDFKEQENVNGIEISLIESHDPYNFNRVFSIQALVGASLYLPEHALSVY